MLLLASAVLVSRIETSVCPTAFFFHVPCPGCGLTRATLALLRGDVAAALKFHPLVFVLAPLFASVVAKLLLDFVRGARVGAGVAAPARAFPPTWWTRAPGLALASALGVLVFGVWLARFAGYFGGPVEVESYRSFMSHGAARPGDLNR